MNCYIQTFVALSIGCLCGCAVPPPDSTRQTLVPEKEVDVVRLTREGLGLMKEGRSLDGELKLLHALRLEPRGETIQSNIGISLYTQNRFDEALQIFSDLEKNDPNSLSYKLWLGKTLLALKEEEKGVAVLLAGIELSKTAESPNDTAIFFNTLSNYYFERGYEEKALCASSESFNASPSPSQAFNHARLLIALGYPQNAAQFTQDFIALGQTPPESLFIFAESAYERNDIEAAAGFLQDALLLQPSDSDLKFLLDLLALIVGRELESRGIDSDLSVLSMTKTEEILTDPRLEGTNNLYLSQKMLRQIRTIESDR